MRKILKILVVQILLLALAGQAYASSMFSLDTGNNQLWSQDTPFILEKAQANDQFGRAIANGDFNGDGFEDMAVGAPGESVGNIPNAGSVNVIYGTSTGLAPIKNQLWNQNSPGILERAENGDRFGYSVATGDFNKDGFDDLVIGVPFENVRRFVDSGVVQVIYGSKRGLTSAGNQLWYQGHGISGITETGDRFGYSLATGDFNGNGFDDLAVGVPGEDVGRIKDAGIINVIYGKSSGLVSAGNQQLWQGHGAAGNNEAGDQFGFSLTSGNFNGDSFFDIFVGLPTEDVGPIVNAGAADAIYGTSSGLSSKGSQQWYQNSPGILGRSNVKDRFGYSVTHGDFNGDGNDDVAIGVPYENIGPNSDAGAVNVIYGKSSTGLSALNNQLWHQSSGIVGKAEPNDRFGFSLTAYDFDGDGSEDLAIGVPYEDIRSIRDAGAVNVIYGTPGVGYGYGGSFGGLTKAGSQQWYQGSIKGLPEAGDKFGFAVAAGNFDGDEFDDLAIGVPYEDVGSITDAGVVNVLYGS